MAEDDRIDWDRIRGEADTQGWSLTDRAIGGPSGGGAARYCLRKELVQAVLKHARLASQLAEAKLTIGGSGQAPSGALDVAEELIFRLRELVRADSSEIGVLKAPLRRGDGRFAREIQILTTVEHPSLVKVYAAATSDDPDWYIMRLYALGDLHARWGSFAGRVVEVLTGTRQIAQALEILHAHKVIHRDIKPANIFVENDGRWVLGDFGIAFDEEGARLTTDRRPDMMSKDWRPEWRVNRQVEKFEAVDDVFSLAKVAYALIAGPGKNPPVSHLDEADFDLRTLHPNVEHIKEVWEFFHDHVTHKPAQVKSKDAKAFVAAIGELLSLYLRRRGQQQLLSMILPHSTIQVADIAHLQNIRVHLPSGVTGIKGSICLRPRNHPGSEGQLRLAIRTEVLSQVERDRLAKAASGLSDLEASSLALREKDVVVGTLSDAKSLGHWIDFEAPIRGRAPPAAYFSLEKVPDNCIVTGLTLLAEFHA